MYKLTKEEIKIIADFMSERRTSISVEQQALLLPIYNRLHPERMYQHTQCASCWREMIGQLAKAYNEEEKILVKKSTKAIKQNIKKANRRRKS
jgi:hypothetical protein